MAPRITCPSLRTNRSARMRTRTGVRPPGRSHHNVRGTSNDTGVMTPGFQNSSRTCLSCTSSNWITPVNRIRVIVSMPSLSIVDCNHHRQRIRGHCPDDVAKGNVRLRGRVKNRNWTVGRFRNRALYGHGDFLCSEVPSRHLLEGECPNRQKIRSPRLSLCGSRSRLFRPRARSVLQTPERDHRKNIGHSRVRLGAATN